MLESFVAVLEIAKRLKLSVALPALDESDIAVLVAVVVLITMMVVVVVVVVVIVRS